MNGVDSEIPREIMADNQLEKIYGGKMGHIVKKWVFVFELLVSSYLKQSVFIRLVFEKQTQTLWNPLLLLHEKTLRVNSELIDVIISSKHNLKMLTNQEHSLSLLALAEVPY